MTAISLSSADPSRLKVDAVVVGIASRDGQAPRGRSGQGGPAASAQPAPVLLPGAEAVDAALGGSLAVTLATLGATGKAGEVHRVPGGGKLAARQVLAVGTGPEPGGPPDQPARRASEHERLRRAAGAAARTLAGTGSAAFALPVPDAAAVGAVAEGVLLGTYAFGAYKSAASQPKWKEPLAEATVVGSATRGKDARAALERAQVLAEAVNRARDWVNTPPRDLAPPAFADAAAAAAKPLGLDVEVLDDAALRRGGYGGIVGVGQGSANPPRLVRLAHRHRRAKRTVALVGKGITFDSGGLSLKPADAMTTMKCDMSGAAAVIAAVIAAARLDSRINVVAYAPMAENMPSGAAQRPSDVLRIYGGRTVEVLNTDAEGRLVLADALARAGEDSPDLIVDVATLTGACVVALGTRVSGIMANDDDLLQRVHTTAERAGEQMWPLPLPDDLREKLDSAVADIANIGDRWGGALQAGIFLREFVPDGVGWVHLDIAGPAFNESAAFGYTPKGGTGAAVRTLVALVEDLAAEDR